MSVALPVPVRRFPGLASRRLGGHRYYFDHACATPTPQEVVDALAEYYRQPPGCPLRSATEVSSALADRVRDARDAVRGWLNARFSDEIVFTANTTMAINLVAGSFARRDGAVLITDLEHNSNRLPWLEQELVELPWPPGTEFPLDAYRRLLRDRRVKLVSLTAMSNVNGARAPLAEVVREAHAASVPVHLDAAQLAIHGAVDVGEIGPEFVSLSLHKAYGPSGLGVLYASRAAQTSLRPMLAGGGSVDDHHDHEIKFTAGAERFEFGLQNYASQYAVPETIAFLRSFDRAAVEAHLVRLVACARERLAAIPGVTFPTGTPPGATLVNFAVEGRDALRIAQLLDLVGRIHVRAGQLCAHHYYHRYRIPATVRMSFGYHNTVEEVDHHARVLAEIIRRYA